MRRIRCRQVFAVLALLLGPAVSAGPALQEGDLLIVGSEVMGAGVGPSQIQLFRDGEFSQLLVIPGDPHDDQPAQHHHHARGQDHPWSVVWAGAR